MSGDKRNWERSNRKLRAHKDIVCFDNGHGGNRNPLIVKKSRKLNPQDDASNARRLLFAGSRAPHKRQQPSLPTITTPEVVF